MTDGFWRTQVVVAMSALVAAACSFAPKYVRPAVPVADTYKEAAGSDGWKPAEPNDQQTRGRWWEAYNDAQLSALEDQVAAQNQSLAAAAANVDVARALVREARAQYFPTVSAAPSIAKQRVSTGFGQSLGVIYTTYTLPVEASWEPDLWGRVRNTVQSTAFGAQAAVADRENVRLAVQAELAGEYFELRASDLLKQILDATVASYEEAAAVTRDRFNAGLEADEAVAQAETQLANARAQDADVGIARAQYEHAIAVLVGQSPSAFAMTPNAATTDVPGVPVGVPSTLLERRPDIAASERAVAQANAQIGIARSAFFPMLALTASAGFQNVTVADWFTWPSRVWAFGPSVVQTIFDAGARRAEVQRTHAAYDEVVANYRQTVLTAFQQVEDNLAAVRILADVIAQQDLAVAAAQRALDDANTRYTTGLDPYLNVIAAQAALLGSRQAAVNSRAQRLVASVQLVKALGGGWQQPF